MSIERRKIITGGVIALGEISAGMGVVGTVDVAAVAAVNVGRIREQIGWQRRQVGQRRLENQASNIQFENWFYETLRRGGQEVMEAADQLYSEVFNRPRNQSVGVEVGDLRSAVIAIGHNPRSNAFPVLLGSHDRIYKRQLTEWKLTQPKLDMRIAPVDDSRAVEALASMAIFESTVRKVKRPREIKGLMEIGFGEYYRSGFTKRGQRLDRVSVGVITNYLLEGSKLPSLETLAMRPEYAGIFDESELLASRTLAEVIYKQGIPIQYFERCRYENRLASLVELMQLDLTRVERWKEAIGQGELLGELTDYNSSLPQPTIMRTLRRYFYLGLTR